MFNFIKNLFDQIFPLKDDPRRAMDVVYQHTIRFGKAITPILAVKPEDEIGVAYQLNHALQNYYSDEVNDTLIDLGLDPSRVTENQLKQAGSELFKAAVISMLYESYFFYEVDSRRGRTINEAFDAHLMNHELEFSTLFPDQTESFITQLNAAKALSLYVDALKPHGIIPIAISLKKGFLLSTIKEDKLVELNAISEQFGIEFGIERFLHPLYYDIFSVKAEDEVDSIPAQSAKKDNEFDSEPESNLADTSHFLDDLPTSKLSKLPFMQKIRQAHDDLYPLLALSTTEKNEFNLAYLEIRENIFNEIENDVWNYLLHTYQSIHEAHVESLTDDMIDAYLDETTIFMYLGNYMMSIPYSIQIDLMDAYTLIEEIIDRLKQHNLAIPAQLTDLLDEAEESIDYEAIMAKLHNLLSATHQMTLVMVTTGEDHSFYFLIKEENLNSILRLSQAALLSVYHINSTL